MRIDAAKTSKICTDTRELLATFIIRNLGYRPDLPPEVVGARPGGSYMLELPVPMHVQAVQTNAVSVAIDISFLKQSWLK